MNKPLSPKFAFDPINTHKNINTHNGTILHALTKTNVRIAMLSGTVADQPVYFVLVGLVLKLYSDYTKGHEWIIKKSKEEHGLNLKRKISVTDDNGDISERVIRRGHFTPQEDVIFLQYRKQYCKSIFELINFFKQHLVS